QRPDVVMQGRDCTNSEAALFILGGVLQHKIILQPGETKTIHLLFGISSSRKEAREAAFEILNDETVEKEFQNTQKYCYGKYGSLWVQTPDKKINHIMNNWVKKQVDFCIIGKKGVRDNLQIAAALLNYRQDKAKEEILECLRHQFKDGHAVLTWYPYDDTRYSDQPFWIIWAVCRLIKETGDFALLEERISWQDGKEAPLLEHVKAAVNRLIADKGRDGLIRIYFADWNDALNIAIKMEDSHSMDGGAACDTAVHHGMGYISDKEAESVMLSHQFCLALKELEMLMKKYGDDEYAQILAREYETLKMSINEKAWDGEWYMRALSPAGNVGAKDSSGSKVYLNAQVWAVLGDVADEEKLPLVLQAVDRMEHDFGYPLNMPPYSEYLPHVGRMSGMLPGLFENGGVYCHATGFKILMDCKTGRGSKAVETLKKIMPDSDKNPSMQSGAEPYVFTNCYSTHPGYYGKSYQSWTTGTSAWCLMGLYEGVMGVKSDYDGLWIEPCFPAAWEYAEMTRHFRGADYHVVIRNPGHVENGTAKIWVDGAPIAGTVLPDFGDGKRHEVEVVLRGK
ncbi:MAG: cellobiose phosphorylase, partial [Lachnospiraceae bacterium]|nr:cellobiose phosphorylase [Lachnospiraceae bacterium]